MPTTPNDPYAFAYTVASDRISHPGNEKHFAFSNVTPEEGMQSFYTVMQQYEGDVHTQAEKALLEGNPMSEEQIRHLYFTAGFFFGRAFEEVQLMQYISEGKFGIHRHGDE